MKNKWSSVICLLTLVASVSLASGFDEEFEKKGWAEIEVLLPPYPEQENLIPFRVGSRYDVQFSIDGNSISVGADGVVRYSLVVIGSQGARNVSYEGMRCATTERRSYAFGQPDKTWSKARSDKWLKIRGDSNNLHVELYVNILCPNEILVADNPDAIRRVLRSGGFSMR